MASVVAPPPSPAAMTSRRVPLGTLSNAANSNFHGTAVPAAKRSRSQSITQRESTYTQQPPIKKQNVEAPSSQPAPILRTPVRNRADPKVMPPRKSTNRTRTVGANALHTIGAQQLQRKTSAELTAAAENNAKTSHAAAAESIEKIRAWQEHYRKVFPTFTFYFESLPEDAALKYQRQVLNLGAHVEKFFSNAVTHVITTRPIPPENVATKSSTQSQGRQSSQQSQRTSASQSQHSSQQQSRNGNPSTLLDKVGTFNGQTHAKAEFTFKAPSGVKKFSTLSRVDGRVISYEESREADSRKAQPGVSQILLKAREWGIKIWALEKLQRMLNAMVDLDEDAIQQLMQPRDHDVAQKAAPADTKLQQILHNERVHGPSDRDPDALSKDMVYFTGYFVMVKDMKATHRPIMVREYDKPAKREDGTWPQFRSTSSGKCPFIDEVAAIKEKEREREEAREQERLLERKRAQEEEEARLRAAAKMQPPAPPQRARATKSLEELNPQDSRLNYGRAPLATQRAQPNTATRLFNVPPVVPAKRISNEMAFTSTNKAGTGHNVPNPKYAYEPAASGLQPSNITSAIRSQMVSSHVDIPGTKTAMSKDMLELKRKVAGNVIEGTKKPPIPLTSRVNNLAALAAGKAGPATALRKESREVHGKPVKIFEDVDPSAIKNKAARKSAPAVKKELKPGYCENCRERFDDFDEHTVSRRHRKFAVNDANFKELDGLLSMLARPLKQT
ncbi:Dfp1/Him1, central region-domain-containing protein [Kalaharituber pfeilii]|nr:Dfp1/Him1, central region-domain-containing protein [Kalaharituber pfeilii]